jgi:hypothetical protein
MSRIGRLTITGALSFWLLLACGDKINPKGEYQPTGAGGTGGAPPAGGTDGGSASLDAGTAPSFTYDIMPLLKKGCLCHVQGGEAPLLDTYLNVKSNANASLSSMQNESMPPSSPLSKSEIDLFQRWINAGTPNN